MSFDSRRAVSSIRQINRNMCYSKTPFDRKHMKKHMKHMSGASVVPLHRREAEEPGSLGELCPPLNKNRNMCYSKKAYEAYEWSKCCTVAQERSRGARKLFFPFNNSTAICVIQRPHSGESLLKKHIKNMTGASVVPLHRRGARKLGRAVRCCKRRRPGR